MFNYGGDTFKAIAAFTTRIISVEYHKKSPAVFPVWRGADYSILYTSSPWSKTSQEGTVREGAIA
jgi:hypothetical protein